jgi:hypothetical protein
MPDGDYHLYVEVTETDKAPGEVDVFTFTKGATAVDSPANPTIAGLDTVTISWTPAP